MGWFNANLRTTCATEISAQNSMVVHAVTGLDAYSLLRNAACLPDPQTNAYCYIEAVQNSNPSDVYFYQLPLGIALPENSTPSCSTCTQSVMALFGQMTNLTALQATYKDAVQRADATCGQSYIQSSSGAARSIPTGVPSLALAMTTVVALLWGVNYAVS